MNRNELLAATRELLQREFAAAMRVCVDNCATALFARAEKAKSSLEERTLYTARDDLTKRAATLHTALAKCLEKLVHRSFQTAYANETSARMQSIRADGLSLVETKTIDFEMRLDAALKRFRDEAGDELRDLNIRVALLFLQETIDERENPFRPYLMVRAITEAIEAVDFSQDVAGLLSDELIDQLRARAREIYAKLNELLAKNGVGTELKLRVQKQSDGVRSKDAAGEQPEQDAAAASAAPAHSGAANDSAAPAPANEARQREVASRARLDQFVQWVRNPSQPPSPLGSAPPAPMAAAEPAQFTTETTADGTFGASTAQMPESAAPMSAEAPRSWVTGVKAVGSAIRRLFSVGRALVNSDTPDQEGDDWSRGDGESRPLMSPTLVPISARLEQSVQQLMTQAVPDVGAMVGPNNAVRNLIMEQREQLTALTSEASEQMTIDVVAMLFEFILRDAEVPSETRAQLGRLQYLVLKVALRDSEFLTHKSHPARMLVNRIGSLAISLRQADPNGAKLNAKVCEIVETLLADNSEDVALFAKLIDDLDKFVATQLRSEREAVELAAQAIERVESRTLKFARITSVIGDALSALPVDDNLRNLLLVTWASVVEQAERVTPTTAARYRELVPVLVWSISPKVDEADRKLLVKMLPGLLRTLRDGLTLLGWPKERQDKELAWLVGSHTRALRPAPVEGKVASLALVMELFKPFLQMREAEEAANVMPSAQLESAMVAAVSKELGTEVQVVDNMVEPETTMKAAGPTGPSAPLSREEQAVIARLRAGVAVELKLVGPPRPGRLTWVSANTKSMVFTYDEKQDTFILSARMFLRLLSSGHARFIDSEPLFERALTALLKSADNLDRAATAAQS